jgi:hypothetical protein
MEKEMYNEGVKKNLLVEILVSLQDQVDQIQKQMISTNTVVNAIMEKERKDGQRTQAV